LTGLAFVIAHTFVSEKADSTPIHDIAPKMVVYHEFDTDKDIPDLSSKVILVTGGNSGVGKESLLQLSKYKPRRLYMTARSKAKYDAALADIKKQNPDANITFLEMDLASFASVKTAASTVLSENDRLDILMNNAGIMAVPPGFTKEGFEIQFGTNHMGHALLTKLLTPLLLKTAEEPNSDVRIINVSSAAHAITPKGGFASETVTTDMAEYHTYTRYGQSKMANIYFSRALAAKYPTITSIAIHPGRVATPLLDRYLETTTAMGLFQRTFDVFRKITVDKGAVNQLWAAVGDRDRVRSGFYYVPVGKEGGNAQSKAPGKPEELWEWQEKQFERLGY
jgi:NAD(P)-dependent dehydrogenase (short-subunit alcohol dehydrogenase family)